MKDETARSTQEHGNEAKLTSGVSLRIKFLVGREASYSHFALLAVDSRREAYMIRSHADVVGSLLRPAELLTVQKKFAAGELQPADFKKIEDKAVDQACPPGGRRPGDRHRRRDAFGAQMTAPVDGFDEHTLAAFLWGSDTELRQQKIRA